MSGDIRVRFGQQSKFKVSTVQDPIAESAYNIYTQISGINTSFYLTFVGTNTTSLTKNRVYTSSGLSYNPSNSTISFANTSLSFNSIQTNQSIVSFGTTDVTFSNSVIINEDLTILGNISAQNLSLNNISGGSTGDLLYQYSSGITTFLPAGQIDYVLTSNGPGLIPSWKQISGISSSVEYAVNAGIATYATSAGLATYAVNAGIATYAVNAGIATYAVNAGIVTYAVNAGIATYATSAGLATYATSAGLATYATSAGLATYAVNAGLATYATSAGLATYATYATSAGLATYATYATSAGLATYAVNAGIATYATSAGLATYAVNAGIATYAVNAGIVTSQIRTSIGATLPLSYDQNEGILNWGASGLSFDNSGNRPNFISFIPQSVNPTSPTNGYVQFADNNSLFSVLYQNGISWKINISGITTTRIWNGPDKNGTIALTNDIVPSGSNGAFQISSNNAFAAAPNLSVDPITGIVTASARYVNSVNSAASAPAVSTTGTWFSGGTVSNNLPHILIQHSAATSNTAWTTNGTGLGVYGSSVSQRLIDAGVNGASFFRLTGNIIEIGPSAFQAWWMDGQTLAMRFVNNLGWSSGNATGLASLDTFWNRFSAGVIYQQGGTTAQSYWLANTNTSSGVNFERMRMGWESNIFTLRTEAGGTGLARGIRIGASSAQLLGFWGATPVSQPAAIANATDLASAIAAVNALLAAARSIGLIAT